MSFPPNPNPVAPTLAGADAYARTKFTPLVAKLFKKWLSWSR